MANQRAADQEFIGIWVSTTLSNKIEAARGGVARSQWVREAIGEYLQKNGFNISPDEKSAPNRVKRLYRVPAPKHSFNDKANSKLPSGVKAGVKKAAEKLAREDQKS